jgi:hypothetical protein
MRSTCSPGSCGRSGSGEAPTRSLRRAMTARRYSGTRSVSRLPVWPSAPCRGYCSLFRTDTAHHRRGRTARPRCRCAHELLGSGRSGSRRASAPPSKAWLRSSAIDRSAGSRRRPWADAVGLPMPADRVGERRTGAPVRVDVRSPSPRADARSAPEYMTYRHLLSSVIGVLPRHAGWYVATSVFDPRVVDQIRGSRPDRHWPCGQAERAVARHPLRWLEEHRVDVPDSGCQDRRRSSRWPSRGPARRRSTPAHGPGGYGHSERPTVRRARRTTAPIWRSVGMSRTDLSLQPPDHAAQDRQRTTLGH